MTTTVPWPRRVRRGRLVALQAGAGCAAAGGALDGAGGYALTGAGVLVAALTVLRVRGRTAGGHLVWWLRRGAFAAPAPRQRARPDDTARLDGAPPDRDPERLGLAGSLFPALEITPVTNRNGPAVGVVCDGRGFAAVLRLPAGVHPGLPVGLLANWLRTDPVRPAAAQLLVEQHGLPSWDVEQHFEPTTAYRQLPAQRHVVAVSSWLVLRYELWEAPEAAERRGGGAVGARVATAAATARLRAVLAQADVPTGPLGADAVQALLREVGDPEGNGRATPGCWAGAAATHCTAVADIRSADGWRNLLVALAESGAERVVAAATVSLSGPAATEHGDEPVTEVRTAVRWVSPLAQRAARACDRLVHESGLAQPLTGNQEDGVVATLPLACPGRSLVETTGFAVGMGER
ncbi:type VII secretion protein EccE [Streptomyces sp. NPDC007063]|uniref:type VII secretion protein EccE n=1 Tax=Streptomyces sp. NPDC007063 TaxID=3364772 RepID=UPI003679C5F7